MIAMVLWYTLFRVVKFVGKLLNKVLIVEDDKTIASQIQNGLRKRGLDCSKICDFENIIMESHSFGPDIILMDLYLPVYDGYYWTRKIREYSKVPIIFVSSAEEKMNTVAAINAGADDFIQKPFDLDILNIKIQSWLRRTYNFDQSKSNLHFRGYVLDLINSVVSLQESSVKLTSHELSILQELFLKQEQIVTKRELMTTLWNNNSFVDENALQVALTRLRKKLEKIGLDQFIITKKRKGYLLGCNE